MNAESANSVPSQAMEMTEKEHIAAMNKHKSIESTMASATMDGTVTLLHALFQKTAADLTFVSRRLDSEFAQQYSDTGHDSYNPRKLLRRLENLHQRLEDLRARSQHVVEAKQDIAETLAAGMEKNSKLVTSLEQVSGIENGPSEVIHFESSVKENIDDDAAADDLDYEEDNGLDFYGKPKRNSEHYLPVTEDEFLGISDLVRGRSKLSDVNAVYEKIFNHFKNKKKRRPLTVQAMTDKLGLRITGQTGEAKLKVLRSLGIIDMSKTGVTIVDCAN